MYNASFAFKSLIMNLIHIVLLLNLLLLLLFFLIYGKNKTNNQDNWKKKLAYLDYLFQID